MILCGKSLSIVTIVTKYFARVVKLPLIFSNNYYFTYVQIFVSTVGSKKHFKILMELDYFFLIYKAPEGAKILLKFRLKISLKRQCAIIKRTIINFLAGVQQLWILTCSLFEFFATCCYLCKYLFAEKREGVYGNKLSYIKTIWH